MNSKFIIDRMGIFMMVNNAFGNYVVQRILDHSTPKYKMRICKLVSKETL